MFSRYSKARWIAGFLVVVFTLIGSASAGAQDGRPNEIEISPTDDFAETMEIDVLVAGLEDFEGGTASLYLCGNADSSGDSITPTANDCFAPGGDGYVVGPIENAGFAGGYTLQLTDIGANNAQCVPADGVLVSCQMVVATMRDGDARIIGVPIDSIVQMAQETQAERNAGATGTLALTGLGRNAILALAIIGAGLLYVGYLLWSAAVPAPTAIPVETRRRR